jgi:hypothetical protein
MANAAPMSRAIEARARTQPVRQIGVGQKLAANGNQIRIAFCRAMLPRKAVDRDGEADAFTELAPSPAVTALIRHPAA